MSSSFPARYYDEVTSDLSHQFHHHLVSANNESSSSTVNVEYIAEGAANVIWSLSIEPALKDKLLRLRKGTWSGVGSGPPANAQHPPPFLSSSQVLDYFLSSIRPLFESGQLVEQELVQVDSGLIARCNARLDELECALPRPRGRRHWHIKHEETFGLLITSMLPTSQKSALFHFKPKWLAQSPTAPANARRCRTCALAAKRETDVARLICPLALHSGEESVIRQQIEARVRGEALMSQDMIGRRPSITQGPGHASNMLRSNITESLIEDFTALFLPGQKCHKLLDRLKTLQLQYDPTGVLNLAPGVDTSDLAMAMTLRDATMFVKITPDGADVRLGDLDPKSGDSARKVQDWRDTEESLITEGWYTGTEDEASHKGLGAHTSCFLWKE